jgi:tyrosine-protein kinase Etk/Wzc
MKILEIQNFYSTINNLDNVSELYYDYFKQYENEELEIQINDNLLRQVEETIRKSKSELDIYSITPLLSGSSYESSISEMLLKLRDLLLQKEELLFQVTPKNSGSKSIEYSIEIQKNIIIESISSLRNKLKDRKVYLNEKLNKYDSQINSLPTKELEFARLQRLFNINEKYYTLLLEKKTEYRISKEGFVPETRILEEAYIPGGPISPNRNFVLSSFLIAGILICGLLVTLKYIFHNNITSLNEISKTSQASIGILGIVPKYNQEIPVSQLLIDKNPKSLISEAFRNIRTNLAFINTNEGAKVIAITSTVSGEGKTFVAINLAGIIAFSGKKVIILDLDMRKPKIHLGFGATNFNGMSTILIGRDSIENCVQKSTVDNLDFITAGPIPPNPAELIISKKMEDIIETLKLTYDMIVIDNPPVGLVTDGISIIQKADFPIYIFRADYSKKQYIQIVDRLKNENKFSKLSVILNSVDTERNKYGYNYGYGYGYGYGYLSQGYYEETTNDKIISKKKSIWKKFFS